MTETRSDLGPLSAQWDALAYDCGNVFMTSAWLRCWWDAFGSGEPLWVIDRDPAGALRAGTLLVRSRTRLASATNVHSGAWAVLGRERDERERIWQAIAEIGAPRIRLERISDRPEDGHSPRSQLERAGYRAVSVAGPFSPYVELPSSWEQLIATVSSGLRQQVGRRRRQLAHDGSVTFRTQTGGRDLERDLQRFLELESSGWKGRNGTSILSLPATERLYRDFANAAAAAGLLRLNMLELDDTLIAASFDCAFAGTGSLLKTAFSEPRHSRSPGLVLLAEALRACIDEGLDCYDFLGEADQYKMRWASGVRPRTQVFAYRGIARPGYSYRKTLRPAMKSGRDWLRSSGSPRGSHLIRARQHRGGPARRLSRNLPELGTRNNALG